MANEAFVNEQAAGITVTEPNEFLQAMAGEDVVHNKLYTSDPALQPKSNYAETQQAAQNIQDSGFQGQQGDYYYNTGNPDLNAALYGNDIAVNMAYDNQGWEIPRNLQDNQAMDIAQAVATSLLTGGLTGGGLFNTIGQIAQGGATVANTSNVIYNLNEMYKDVTEDDAPAPPSSIAGGLFGDEFGVDFDSAVLGQTITGPGGLYDLITVDRPAAPETSPPSNIEGGGGGSTGSDSTVQGAGGVQLPRTEMGQRDTEERLEDVYIYNGQGELVSVSGDDRISVPNPGRLTTGGVYTSDAEPVVRGEQTAADSQIGSQEEQQLDDLLLPGWSSNTWNGTNGTSVTVTQNGSSTPGVNLPGSQNGMSPDGDMWQPGEIQTGGTGGGTGGGNGAGSGDGTGDGDGDGEGEGDGSGSSTPNLLAGSGGDVDNGDLFPYTRIDPSRPATLAGLMDYVAALRG